MIQIGYDYGAYWRDLNLCWLMGFLLTLLIFNVSTETYDGGGECMPPSYGNAPVWAIHQILIIQITL
jgi:hypothetical protein